MYSKQRNTKTSKQFNDVNIGNDKGSLRLQFSTRISEKFYNKRQAYKGLGRSDTPDNRVWAEGIARRIQEDIDYQNGINFDPTLAKYLDIKPMLATVTQLPTAKPLPTLGELWEEFIENRLKSGRIHQTTYQRTYLGIYTPLIKEFFDCDLNEQLANKVIEKLLAKQENKIAVKTLFGLLSEMSKRAIRKDKLMEDYFLETFDNFRLTKKSRQLKDAEDYKAYTIQQRDLIIGSYRSHNRASVRHLANLVEFLFLTGCRHGEAFALQWKHVKFDTGWIVFKISYDGKLKLTKGTKTDVDRIFKMSGMTRLIELLKNMHQDAKNPDDLVFISVTGKQCNSLLLHQSWWQYPGRANNKSYSCPGVVTKLAEEGKLQYLKPYSTRHTFISIQANNSADLKLLADSCGNSVDMIIEHYLDANRDATLKDI